MSDTRTILFERARQQHVPLSASFELTQRCNLRCVHCYAGPCPTQDPDELTTGEVLHIIDEVAEAQCLYMLFTGGEPLLRRDFPEIYLHAKKRGLLVTLFTNATLVTPVIVELLRDWPPRVVDVTLYGASQETYESVTGIPGSYARSMAGLKLLREANIPLMLKTMLLTLNAHECENIEAIAAQFGSPVHFRIDPSIHARLNGDTTPLQYRVDAETAARFEMQNSNRREQWCKYGHATSPTPAPGSSMYSCGAGRIVCHIDAHGFLKPCLMHMDPGYNLRSGSFRHGWDTAIPKAIDKTFNKTDTCRTCPSKQWCGFCPERLLLDTGSRHAPSAWLCQLAEARKRISAQP